MGYGRLKKMEQGKDTLNNNQNIPCQSWWHGPMFFIHIFMCLVLLLLLYHNGKITIHHYHLFLLLHNLHLFLFKSLQRQVELIISGDSRGGLEMAIIAYHFWREMMYHLFGTYLLWSIFDLFLSVSFEQLSSWCCNNMSIFAWLSVVGEQILRYWAVTLTS